MEAPFADLLICVRAGLFRATTTSAPWVLGVSVQVLLIFCKCFATSRRAGDLHHYARPSFPARLRGGSVSRLRLCVVLPSSHAAPCWCPGVREQVDGVGLGEPPRVVELDASATRVTGHRLHTDVSLWPLGQRLCRLYSQRVCR